MNDKKLTPKMKKFANEYVDCGNGAEAARKAGYSEKRADQQAYENLRKPEIKNTVSELMNQQNLSPKRLLKELDAGFKAEITKPFAEKGVVIEERTYTDYSTRHKYLETALKLQNMFPADKLHIKDVSDKDEEEEWEGIQRMIAKKDKT